MGHHSLGNDTLFIFLTFFFFFFFLFSQGFLHPHHSLEWIGRRGMSSGIGSWRNETKRSVLVYIFGHLGLTGFITPRITGYELITGMLAIKQRPVTDAVMFIQK